MHQQRDGSAFRLIMLAVFFGNFMASLSTTSINVALPVFMDDFQADLSTVQWMLSGFMMATGVIAPIIGFMGDRWSYKRVYVMALTGFTLTSLLCVFAWSIESLISFRILQGLCSGIIMPTTMTIIYQTIAKEKQAAAVSFWSMSAMLAPALGPTIGGWLTELYGWKALFLMNIPVGVTAVAVAARCIPSYRLSRGISLDWIGFGAVLAGTSSLLVAFSEAHEWGWAGWQTLALIAAGVLILAYFVIRTLKVSNPLLNLRVLQIPGFTYGLILNCAITVSLYAGALLVPIYMQNIKGATSFATGMVMLPGTLAMALVSILAGRLYGKLGPSKLILIGLLLMAVATWELSYAGTATGVLFVTMWVAIRYIGIGFSNMPVTNAAMSAVPSVNSGHASAVMNWIRQGTSALSISLFSSILSARTIVHLNDSGVTETMALTLSVQDVFHLGTAIIVVSVPLILLLRKPKAQAVGSS
ncbi:DHA2 family efflux MFS transporter permease subunit [Paenibacillus sp. N4]|uniref:DHA2 family efflux MFS transporter permease subunit n=1 Tax=Paenibacillus vietnamensis TaxID=2590547 RepID=UPI001CD0F3F3|nr:DHA2 family efflux MFS transporter permease subunit [Paenibacillus vietnamensis]MCA0756569.1 DHA2 family efflux MFS transporter permease subunit [Paenibacillus vietnamensis]